MHKRARYLHECHATAQLMAEFNLPVDVVREYRESVHGRLLLEEGDTGAPTCATCHGNHSAMPPGFAEVGAVCGQCHQHAATTFAASVHAMQEEHKGCVECHGGGEGRTFHLIERITRVPGAMIDRYAHLLASNTAPTPEEVTENIHPEAREIMIRALPTCLECHEEPDDDESLAKIFDLLDEIAGAERHYVRTARRLDDVGQGILLVDNQRFRFEDAKTLLIELAPLQHILDNATIAAKVAELDAVCDEVNGELDDLQAGLRRRYRVLIPIWAFAILFSAVLYAKYRQLKRVWVKPRAGDSER